MATAQQLLCLFSTSHSPFSLPAGLVSLALSIHVLVLSVSLKKGSAPRISPYSVQAEKQVVVGFQVHLSDY